MLDLCGVQVGLQLQCLLLRGLHGSLQLGLRALLLDALGLQHALLLLQLLQLGLLSLRQLLLCRELRAASLLPALRTQLVLSSMHS